MLIVVLAMGEIQGKRVPVRFDIIPENDSDAKYFSEWVEANADGLKAQAFKAQAKIFACARLVSPRDFRAIGKAKQKQAEISGVLKRRMELASQGWKGIWRPST